jgi:hypothetical protein
MVTYGVNTLPVMGMPGINNSLGVHKVHSLSVAQQQHTPQVLKDEDFPSLL